MKKDKRARAGKSDKRSNARILETRSKVVEQIAGKLSLPRIQLSLILGLTALLAFLFNFLLLLLGAESMAVRYALDVVFGYAAFLLLLRIWAWLQSDDPIGSISLPDLFIPDIDIAGSVGGAADKFDFGGGGDFAGAGAGGSWSDSDVPAPSPVAFASVSGGGSGGSGIGSSGLGSFDLDLDDGWVIVILLVILAIILGAIVYVIYIAPVLMAELLIDAAVVTSIYQPVKNIERRFWLRTALWKTAIPAVVILILFFAAGFLMQSAEPEARTIGEFLNKL